MQQEQNLFHTCIKRKISFPNLSDEANKQRLLNNAQNQNYKKIK